MATLVLTKIHLTLVFIFAYFLCINTQITFLDQACYNDDTSYGIDYEDNIHKAVDQYKSEASNTYYSTDTTGVDINQVHTLFSCRYDISPETCQSCVASIANNVSWCLPSVHGFVIYEECIFVFSNLSMSTIMEVMPWVIHYSHRTHIQEVHFSTELNKTLSDLIDNVVSEFDVSSRYFAMKKNKYWSKENIYALAQCNPDIDAFNCTRCLNYGSNELATNATGAVYGQYFTPMCRLSYILTHVELSRPWSFFRTFNHTEGSFLSTGTRGNSVVGAIIACICSVALLSLKLLL